MHTLELLAIATVGFTASACEPSASATPVSAETTTAASPGLVSTNQAVEGLTQARCTRQLSCGFVGKGRFFEDYDSCWRDMRRMTRDYIKEKSCGEGIDEWALSTCVNDVRNNPCDDPHGAIDSIPSCSSVRLCR